MLIPNGISCLVHPLKKIIPYIQSSFLSMMQSHLSNAAASRKKIGVNQTDAEKWLSVILQNLKTFESDLLATAFDSLEMRK